jgi:integrase
MSFTIMRLQQVLEEIVGERDIQPITEQQYRRSLKSFELFLGRLSTTEDLTPESVNKWIRAMQPKRSPTTCANYKAGLLILWNRLAERSVIAPYHRKTIRQIKRTQNPVVAWTLDEIHTLLKCCPKLEGYLRGTKLKASDFMYAWILFAFETGMRPGDVREITDDQIDFEERTVSIVQHKTRQPHVALLSQRTIDAIKKLSTTGLIFPLGKTGVRKWERKLYLIAKKEFGFKIRARAGIGTLRKSHATEVFTEFGLDAAARSLGHIGGTGIARKHYVDSRAINVGTLPRIELENDGVKRKPGSRSGR